MTDVEVFRNHILEAGILDPEGTHHEFVGGMHGRKLHFDLAEPGTAIYDEWVLIGAKSIRKLHPDPRGLIIVGVANGTNEVVIDIAEELGKGVIGLQTEKIEPRRVKLTKVARHIIRVLKPKQAVAFEDASSVGTVVVTAVEDTREAGIDNVSVLTTWKRRHRLELLEQAEASYEAIIDEPIPTYTPKDCRKIGHCAARWQLIKHGS